MLVWACVIAYFAPKEYKKPLEESAYNSKQISKMILLCWLPMVFFATFRSVVSDTTAYTRLFNRIPNNLSLFYDYVSSMGKDKVFWALSMFFKCTISDNYHAWFFLITMVCVLLLAKVYSKYSENPMLSAFMFLLTCYFTWLFNGMRQFLAVCIVFAGFNYIIKGEWLKYLLVCLLASLMHISAIICFPVYFIVRGHIGNKKVLLSLIGMAIVIAELPVLLPSIDTYLLGTEYNDVISQFSEDDGVNIIRVIINLVPICLFLFFRKEYKEEIPQKVSIAFNMSVLCVIVTILGVFTSGIYVGRLTIYFELYSLILYPWIFRNLIKADNKKIIIPGYYAAYFLFYYYQMVITWDGFGYVSDTLGIYLR